MRVNYFFTRTLALSPISSREYHRVLSLLLLLLLFFVCCLCLVSGEPDARYGHQYLSGDEYARWEAAGCARRRTRQDCQDMVRSTEAYQRALREDQYMNDLKQRVQQVEVGAWRIKCMKYQPASNASSNTPHTPPAYDHTYTINSSLTTELSFDSFDSLVGCVQLHVWPLDVDPVYAYQASWCYYVHIHVNSTSVLMPSINAFVEADPVTLQPVVSPQGDMHIINEATSKDARGKVHWNRMKHGEWYWIHGIFNAKSTYEHLNVQLATPLSLSWPFSLQLSVIEQWKSAPLNTCKTHRFKYQGQQQQVNNDHREL